MTEVEARSAASRLHDQLDVIVELLHRHEADGRLPADVLVDLRQQLDELHHKSHDHCYIANSVSAQIVVEPR